MDEELVAQPTGAAPEGLAAELSQFAKESGVVAPQPQPAPVGIVNTAPAPAPEPAPQAVEPKPEVPAKFQTPDGQPDLAKVEKSTVNAEAAISKYLAKERELRQLQNKVQALQKEVIPPPQPQAQPQAPAYDMGSVTPQAIMEDLVNSGMSVDMAKQMATTQYKLALIAQETAYNRANRELESRLAVINDRVEADSRQKELEAIGKSDPWVFSEEGFKTLAELRQAHPYLNSSDRPWSAAYDKYCAEQFKQHRAGGPVSTPTPKAPTASPVTPVGAAPRPEAAPSIDFSDPYRYEARLAHLPLDKQLDILEKELNRRGLPVKK